MTTRRRQLYLASASPRRRELLTQVGVEHLLRPQQVDESPMPGEAVDAYVQRLARAKALAALDGLGEEALVLGADTVVSVEGLLLGKPEGRDHCLEMLTALSDRWHQVSTAVALAWPEPQEPGLSLCLVSTRVRFKALSVAEMEAYWDSGEPLDKAGGYGIQGLGAMFVADMAGSYSNVVGLPLFETVQLLESHGMGTEYWLSQRGERQ